ncbi:MAG: 50S ribosomal protein L29 [Chloroflexi bacterium]|nr:50S ribosomal protein L29 [Chloroflexota bacterium]
MNQKAAELRALNDSELHEQLEATHRELFNLRFGLATRQMANSAELTKVKRKIARIRTILRERDFAEAAAKEGSE